MANRYNAKNSLGLDGRLLEQSRWVYSRLWFGCMDLASHGVTVDHIRTSLVVVAHTLDRPGVGDSRATSLVGEGMASTGRRAEDM